MEVWNHIFNFINTMSLKCETELAIPGIIHNHGKPMTLSELICTTNSPYKSSKCLSRLKFLLIHSDFDVQRKISESDEEEGYVLTDASRLLILANPLSLRPFLLSMLVPNVTKSWRYLSIWIQNDDPMPFDTAHGTLRVGVMQSMRRQNLSHFFNDAMATLMPA